MPAISTIGLGRSSVNGRSRSPLPPARMTAYIVPAASEPRVADDPVPVRRGPVERPPDAGLEVDGRLIAEQAAGLLDRRAPAGDVVPRAPRRIADAGRIAGELVDERGQAPDGNLPARREIHCLADGLVGDARGEQTPHDIPDVREVAGLFTGAGDRQGLLAHRPVEKIRDDIPVAAGDLAGSVNVEESRPHDRQLIVVMEEVAVELAEQLRDLIRRVEI